MSSFQLSPREHMRKRLPPSAAETTLTCADKPGGLAKIGLANNEGPLLVQFSEASPFVVCSAVLAGPFLQVVPRKKLHLFAHGVLEVDLGEFVDVKLNNVPMDPADSGLPFPIWVFYLSRKPFAESLPNNGTGRESFTDRGAPRRRQSSTVQDLERRQIVMGTRERQDMVVWNIEIQKAVVLLAKTKLVQSQALQYSKADLVDLQRAQAMGSSGSDLLQDVTQLQRNVALMGLKQGRLEAMALAVEQQNARVRGVQAALEQGQDNLGARRRSLTLGVGGAGDVEGGGSAVDDEESERLDIAMYGGKEVADEGAYLKKSFRRRYRGSYYLFWGRVRIRTSLLVRFSAILVSYPFVVIYSVLDMDKMVSEVNRGLRKVVVFGVDFSVLFKNARKLVIAVNLTLLFMPIVLVYGLMGFSHDIRSNTYDRGEITLKKFNASMQTVVILTVGLYSAVFLVPIAIAIARKNRATTNQTDVVDGTFCFRPHYKLRLTAKQPMTCNLNTANLSTLGGVAIEFFIHSFYCLPKCQLEPEQCNLANFELPPKNFIELWFHVKWRYLFWVCFAFTVFNAAVFVTHGVLSGKKKYKLSTHFWLWQFVWVLNGPAFVTIVMTLFQAFSCVMVKDNSTGLHSLRLLEDTDLACWDASHKSMCVAAFVGLSVYMTQAALLPSGTYKETMRNKLFDILYVPAYLEGHFSLKALFAAVYVLSFRASDFLRIPMLLMVNISLLLLNMREQPCAVEEINTLRTATLAGTVWAGSASLLFVTQLQSKPGEGQEGQEGSSCGGKGFLALLFLTGWVMLFAGAAYIGYTNKKSIDSVLAHTFLELERQVEQSNKAAQTGPLVGPDYKPLLLNGVELPVAEALRDWPDTVARLKAAAGKAAERSAKAKADKRLAIAEHELELQEQLQQQKRHRTRSGSVFTDGGDLFSRMLGGLTKQDSTHSLFQHSPHDGGGSPTGAAAAPHEADPEQTGPSFASASFGSVASSSSSRQTGAPNSPGGHSVSRGTERRRGSVIGAAMAGVVDSVRHGASGVMGILNQQPHDQDDLAQDDRNTMATGQDGHGSEVREGLTDDDIAAIFAINAKAKLGSVAPRVLEPIISLTLSEDFGEVLHASKYIRELVWCTSINYPRVQFQALWALANLCQTRIVKRETSPEGEEAASDATHSQQHGHRGSTLGGSGGGYDEHMQRLLALAAEQKLPLKEGDDLGEKFRELIVSTDYIMSSGDDDATEMVGTAIRETSERSLENHNHHHRHRDDEYDDDDEEEEEDPSGHDRGDGVVLPGSSGGKGGVRRRSRRRSSNHVGTREHSNEDDYDFNPNDSNDSHNDHDDEEEVEDSKERRRRQSFQQLEVEVGLGGGCLGSGGGGQGGMGSILGAKQPTSMMVGGAAGVKRIRQFGSMYAGGGTVGGSSSSPNLHHHRNQQQQRHTQPRPQQQLDNVGFRKRSVTSSMRNSIVNHAMADTVRRMSLSGVQDLVADLDHNEGEDNDFRATLDEDFDDDEYHDAAGGGRRSSIGGGRRSSVGGGGHGGGRRQSFSSLLGGNGAGAFESGGHASVGGDGHHHPVTTRGRASTADSVNSAGAERRATMDLSAELEGFGFTLDKFSENEFTHENDGDHHRHHPTDKLLNAGGGKKGNQGGNGGNPGGNQDVILDDLYDRTRDYIPNVNENSLGGLRVIYSGFRDMNDTVKLEALGVMVNLSISDNVADSLVFHQDGDTLTHLLEMVWAPSVFTKFACLVLTNLATKQYRRVVILRRGGLAAVVGLLLGSNYELQVSACRCLVNLALSPEKHVPLFASDVFMERLLTKLAPVEHPEVQLLVTTLIRHLSVRTAFARAMNKPERKFGDRLKKLRDSHEHGKDIMEVTNTLIDFRTNEQRAEEFMARMPTTFQPINAEVTWDTWSSKLERMWDPVLTIAPVAKGLHVHVGPHPHVHDIDLSAHDTHGAPLRFKVVTKPEHGSLFRPAGEPKHSTRFLYTPRKGWMGTDYFTFVASNSVMDSNLGTVSIKVDYEVGVLKDQERAEEEEERKRAEALEKEIQSRLVRRVSQKAAKVLGHNDSKWGGRGDVRGSVVLPTIPNFEGDEDEDEDGDEGGGGGGAAAAAGGDNGKKQEEEERMADLPRPPLKSNNSFFWKKKQQEGGDGESNGKSSSGSGSPSAPLKPPTPPPLPPPPPPPPAAAAAARVLSSERSSASGAGGADGGDENDTVNNNKNGVGSVSEEVSSSSTTSSASFANGDDDGSGGGEGVRRSSSGVASKLFSTVAVGETLPLLSSPPLASSSVGTNGGGDAEAVVSNPVHQPRSLSSSPIPNPTTATATTTTAAAAAAAAEKVDLPGPVGGKEGGEEDEEEGPGYSDDEDDQGGCGRGRRGTVAINDAATLLHEFTGVVAPPRALSSPPSETAATVTPAAALATQPLGQEGDDEDGGFEGYSDDEEDGIDGNGGKPGRRGTVSILSENVNIFGGGGGGGGASES